MDGPVGGLCCDIFVERIPSDTLNVMVVFRDLSHAGSSLGIVYSSNVVHAPGDEEYAVRRPSEIVYLRPHGPAHVFDPPCFLVLEAFLEVRMQCLILSWHPKEDIAVVACGCQGLSSGTPSDHVHSLCMLYEG